MDAIKLVVNEVAIRNISFSEFGWMH